MGSLREFWQRYERPAREEPGREGDLVDELVQRSRPPLMLRRLKEDHLRGLPEKRVERYPRQMPDAQAAAYASVVQRAVARRGEPGAVLQALQQLRRVSLLGDFAGPEGITDDLVACSARLAVAIEVLDRIAERGEKALVFVDYLDIQDALIPYLQRRYGLPAPPPRISGEVTGPRRQSLVDAFQSSGPGFAVMILSPRAGGVGLTLTAANHVVHLSRWWNPPVEDQCTDWVYRIGQERTVWVHLPIAVHPRYGERSFDHNLDALLERKRALSRAVLAPPMVGDDEIEELYRNTVAEAA